MGVYVCCDGCYSRGSYGDAMKGEGGYKGDIIMSVLLYTVISFVCPSS